MDFLSKTFKVCLYIERISLRVVLLACDLLLSSHMNWKKDRKTSVLRKSFGKSLTSVLFTSTVQWIMALTGGLDDGGWTDAGYTQRDRSVTGGDQTAAHWTKGTSHLRTQWRWSAGLRPVWESDSAALTLLIISSKLKTLVFFDILHCIWKKICHSTLKKMV